MKLGLARSIRDGAALGWAIAASLELWAIALLSSYVHVNFMVADHFWDRRFGTFCAKS